MVRLNNQRSEYKINNSIIKRHACTMHIQSKENYLMNRDRFLKEIQGKHLNFLIGAGATCGLIPTLNLKLQGKSFENLLTSNIYNEGQRRTLYFIWFELWIRKMMINEDSSSSGVLKQYERFVENLVTFLNDEGFDKPKRINIFCSNYDTSFEYIFDKLSKENRLTYFNDGSRGFFKKFISTENFNLQISHVGVSDSFRREIPTINLLKMHGSITWLPTESEIEVNNDNPNFTELCNMRDYIASKIDEFNKDFTNQDEKLLSVEEFEEQILNNESLDEIELGDKLGEIYRHLHEYIDTFYEKYKKLLIVSPSKEKFYDTVFQQHYYQLLRMLSFELEKNDAVLIVFGFSFADEHILEIVRRSIVNPKLKIYIIAFNQNAKKEIERRLGNLRGRIIDYLPTCESPDGREINGNFAYLNSLFDGRETE